MQVCNVAVGTFCGKKVINVLQDSTLNIYRAESKVSKSSRPNAKKILVKLASEILTFETEVNLKFQTIFEEVDK